MKLDEARRVGDIVAARDEAVTVLAFLDEGAVTTPAEDDFIVPNEDKDGPANELASAIINWLEEGGRDDDTDTVLNLSDGIIRQECRLAAADVVARLRDAAERVRSIADTALDAFGTAATGEGGTDDAGTLPAAADETSEAAPSAADEVTAPAEAA